MRTRFSANIRIGLFMLATVGVAATQGSPDAKSLYQAVRYEEALRALKDDRSPESLALTGQCWFMLGESKKSTEWLEKAVALQPANPEWQLWLGRAYGRRAETAF